MALQLHMSWQPSLLSQKRKTGPPLGLKNLGNSCYLNSVLQCLTYTPPLANFCLNHLHSSLCDLSADAERKRDCPFCILEKRIVRSLRLDLAQDAPTKIQSCLRLFAEHFRCGRQEDAHEFLRYVIGACHDTCLRLNKSSPNPRKCVAGSSTIVKEIFGGALQSQVKCLLCGGESNKVDDIMDISLDILRSSSLKDALHKFFQPEVLDGNNKYKCEKCKRSVAARKQMSVFQAPNVLVIQLKRFEGIYGGKIDKAISFEELLVLSNFMCKGSQDSSPEYNLFGIIVHAGFSPDSGHYYAYVKDAVGRWYCCNDAYVSVATLEEVLSEKVYILFYSRAKQRPTSTNSVFSGNGVKSCPNNGVAIGTSKKQPSVLPSKLAHAKALAESTCKDPSAPSKGDKLTSGPPMKFRISGNIGSKRVPAVTNGKVLIHENHLVEKNSYVKKPVHVSKSEKDSSSSAIRNGLNKENKVNMLESQRNQGFEHEHCNGNDNTVDPLYNMKNRIPAFQNGTSCDGTVGVKSVQSDLHMSNGAMRNGSVPDYHNLCDGGFLHRSDISRSNGKTEDYSCILLSQDTQSRVKVEELKEVLKNEASSVLRSCGWSDEVYSFMRTKKRKFADKSDNTSLDTNRLRNLLIAEAKPTFISLIPESLKENLVGRLQSFSQEKG